MAGALAERDFADKLRRAGFADIEVLEREPVGIEELALYPLFSHDLIDLMRRLIPARRHGDLASSVVLAARRS